MEQQLVSICMPVFNGAKYLRIALDSALAQEYDNFEIVIVDDGSSDDTVAIAKEYRMRSERIKIFINQHNLGLTGNWNRCVELAGGEWIKFLFQDDLLTPNCLSRFMEFAKEDVSFMVSNREFIFDKVDENIRNGYMDNKYTLDRILKINAPGYISAAEITRIVSGLVNTNFFGEPTAVIFRKKLINEIGSFRTLMVQICDLEYWLRISLNYGMFYIPENLAAFRVHDDSMSAQNRRSGRYLIDKIILTYDLLHARYYEGFRKRVSAFVLLKLKLMLRLRVFEANKILAHKQPDSKAQVFYDKVRSEIPSITEFEKPSLWILLLNYFVKLRRLARS